MSLDKAILNEINEKLSRIEKKLNIVPDREIAINDYENSLESFQDFAKNILKLEPVTIKNYSQIILKFLNHSNGIINPNTVKSFFDSNGSISSKSNHLKALRKYARDFLKLGNWIEDFKFENNSKLKIKSIPDDVQLSKFYDSLPTGEIRLIFLILHNSGLRIGEVLSLKVYNVDTTDGLVDASEIHQGETKHSWFSCITQQTCALLDEFIERNFDYTNGEDMESLLFSTPTRTVQQAFKDASSQLGIEIHPHLLRTVFADRCTKAGIKDKYIDAFCGRISKGVLAKHYTAYSEDAMVEVYANVEPLLVLSLD